MNNFLEAAKGCTYSTAIKCGLYIVFKFISFSLLPEKKKTPVLGLRTSLLPRSPALSPRPGHLWCFVCSALWPHERGRDEVTHRSPGCTAADGGSLQVGRERARLRNTPKGSPRARLLHTAGLQTGPGWGRRGTAGQGPPATAGGEGLVPQTLWHRATHITVPEQHWPLHSGEAKGFLIPR